MWVMLQEAKVLMVLLEDKIRITVQHSTSNPNDLCELPDMATS